MIAATLAAAVLGAAAEAQTLPAKQAVAQGRGGAAATVDPLATRAAIDVLRRGGNAVDAAVAAAAMLGVVEPYSCGIGGGGFMVIYRAADRRVFTIDGRETAPAAFRPDSFMEGGSPIPFAERVTSGLGVGVPGTLRTWMQALERFGTRQLGPLMRPAADVAEEGFVADQTYHDQTETNRARFADFTSTRAVFLTPEGQSPPVGSVVRNPDLARTYRTIASRGLDPFYRGAIADAIVQTVQNPPVVPGTTRNVRPGVMTKDDLRTYRAPFRDPASSGYRGVRHFGMGPPSSGGSTVGEALNILEGYPLGTMPRPQAHHYYLEASAFSFADRGRYLGDSDFVSVPLQGLLSDSFAAERRALIGATAAPKPVPPGDPADNEGESTTHLTVADRWGNVVSYTFTIESTGGSGITVPAHGFLLNNELTDFEPTPGLANSPAGGKRPRSSMSPTIVLRNGRPEVAVGSPGGATIITTVLQILVNHFDFGMTLPQAVEAPRASQRNTTATNAEPPFIATDGPALQALGHEFSSTSEIGAATGIDFLSGGVMQAVAESVRRGGGDARAIGPRGNAAECAGPAVISGTRAGTRIRVTTSPRVQGMPASGRLLRVRGAGVNRSVRLDLAGAARFTVTPRRAGVLRLRVAGTPCTVAFRIRASGIRDATPLTGRASMTARLARAGAE